MRALLPLLLVPAPLLAQAEAADDPVAAALARAGGNRAALEDALARVPEDQRGSLEHLVAHMPARDLTSLGADFLLDHVRLAHEARAAVPWGPGLCDELFLAEVLPYAHLNEEREAWRADLLETCLPLIEEAETPGEAAHLLNQRLFPLLEVRYSRDRNRPDQAPSETIETGMASCTGLSILLADACRAVAIPARVVGTVWTDGSGNHTWVEVWDDGWHFAGAAEPSGAGLDHAWFTGKAKAAVPGGRNAVWAASFAPTEDLFPLVWLPDQDYVHAVDVTGRYAPPAAPPADPHDGLREVARGWFEADAEARAGYTFDVNLDRLVAQDVAAATAAAWTTYRELPLHDEVRADLAASRVRAGGHESPYVVKEVGARPDGGWPLVIAMHGGGGVPKRVNDSQWDHMQVYYREQAGVGGYKYLALRAPNDRWNGFYDTYCWPLVTALIRQQVLAGDVDPDRVSLVGYSHGGYGAFAIGTRIADRFAAVHASAAAPTPGITSARNLRNTPFTFMIGERDTAYGRAERCQAFDEELRALAEANHDAYPYEMEWIDGHGHGGLPDRDKAKQLVPQVRDAAPRALSWELTDDAVADFAWVTVPEPGPGMSVEARCADNVVTLTTEGVGELWVWLDARLVDLAEPVTVVRDGAESTHAPRPGLAPLCESLERRGDPRLAFPVKVVLAP